MPGDKSDDKAHQNPVNGKVIDLQGHQAAEQVLDDLLRADRRSPAYHRLVARAVGVGPPVLAALVRRLDSSRPMRLAALGRLAATYPARGPAIKALARAAGDRCNSDSRRLGAMLVLTEYLAVPPVDDFLATLKNPALTLAGALVGAFGECLGEPEMLHAYVGALMSQPLEVLYAILRALEDMPGEAAVAAIRLLALQPEPELMQGAIEALAARNSHGSIQSLAMLEPNLPNEASRAVSRLLHKLRLSGYGGDLFAPHGYACRALLGPIDGQGKRLLAIKTPYGTGESGIYLNLTISEATGLVSASVECDGPPQPFPAPAAMGTLHGPLSVQESDAQSPVWSALLEVPFGYGLRLLRDSVRANWEAGTGLPDYYQLYFQAIWRYGGALEDAGLVPRPVPGAEPTLFDSESELLSDPLFDSWYLDSGAVYVAAQELLAQHVGLPEEMTDESWRALLPLVIKLAHAEFGHGARKRYATRLRLMAEWLVLAGRDSEAQLALSAAETMLVSPPEANLFVLALVQKGILVALDNLLSGDGIRV